MGLWDKFTDILHDVSGVPTADEKRNAASQANAQIGLYKKQSELAQGELARAKDAQDSQKRRIQEKQIRGLRRNFRPAGFLDNAVGTSDKLGG